MYKVNYEIKSKNGDELEQGYKGSHVAYISGDVDDIVKKVLKHWEHKHWVLPEIQKIEKIKGHIIK